MEWKTIKQNHRNGDRIERTTVRTIHCRALHEDIESENKKQITLKCRKFRSRRTSISELFYL